MRRFLQGLAMMLTALTLAFTAVFFALWSTALAEPRYPDFHTDSTIADHAAVLSRETVNDLTEAIDIIEDETDVFLHVVTVDFLDGVSLQHYGEGLREHWGLGDDDLLLLLCVGEDKFGLFGGRDVNRRLPSSTQQRLLSAYLEEPFLRQDYDGAINTFLPALAQEIARSWGEEIDLSGLFGAAAKPLDMSDWLTRRVETEEQVERHTATVDLRDDDSGISLGKALLTIFLLMVIFGNSGKRRNRRSCGCGCMPFSSLLAGIGLWNLWGKKR